MKLLISLFHPIVFSNFWISIAAGSLAYLTYTAFNIKVNFQFVLLSFLVTFISYNFQRLVRINQIKSNNLDQQKWIKKHQQPLKVALLISLILSLTLITQQTTLQFFILFFILGVISLFYALPLKKVKGLRNIPFIKLFLIAFSWIILCIILPFSTTKTPINWSFTAQLFLFFIAITIPFDIRDVNYDTQPTIPKVVGWKKAKLFSLLLILISTMINFYTLHFHFLYLTYLITFIILFFVSKNNKELYYSGVLDGTIYLFLATYIIFDQL